MGKLFGTDGIRGRGKCRLMPRWLSGGLGHGASAGRGQAWKEAFGNHRQRYAYLL